MTASAGGEPMTTTKGLRAVVLGLAVKTGRSPPELLPALGLAPDALGDPDGRVPHSVFDRAWALAEQLSGDANLGLSVVEMLDGAPTDSLDYALWYQPSVRAMFAALFRYQRLMHDAAASAAESRAEGMAVVLRLRGAAFGSRHAPVFVLGTWLLRLRRATTATIAPVTVRFTAPAPAEPRRYQRTFGEDVRFGAVEDALIFAPAVFDLAGARADEALREEFEAHVRRQLSSREAPSDEERWLAVLRARLTEALVRGEPTVERVAALMHASPRTLQRRLQLGGTSFRAQLDAVRQELAAVRLREPGGSVTEVAFLLGFSDVTAFTRAFRRWTGVTPVQFLRGQSTSARDGVTPEAAAAARALKKFAGGSRGRG